MEPDKKIIDEFTKRALVDLYATIAGITSGYLSVVKRDFALSLAEAQKEMMKIDAAARDAVAKAYHIYTDRKEEDEEK